MNAPEKIKQEIVTTLQSGLNLEKVILFGSLAKGTGGDESDIDILVVTADEHIPKDYTENMHHYIKVASLLREIKKRVPVDLIVHTKPMHRAFLNMGSLFSKEVMQKGEVLYEKNL